VEVYDRERYFTFTGNVVGDFHRIVDAPGLEAFAAEYRRTPTVDLGTLPPARLTALTDDEVLATIQASRDAAAFHRLYIAVSVNNQSGSRDGLRFVVQYQLLEDWCLHRVSLG
jgi:hypothetical protein